ncbi:hypothetical protein IW262DRAFT_1498433 [Armillaria fumosa]|nr:hypothetical protein IW262DRAFT_1498433 [Armillaria fumosa]
MSERLPSNDYPLGSNEHTIPRINLVWSSKLLVVAGVWSPQVAARVLGYALRHSPSVEGKAQLAQDILDCNNNGEYLAGLSYLYVMGMIRVFTNPKAMAGNIAAALAQPTISSSKAKDLALARDNYRCIVSGIVDLVRFEKDPMRFNEAPKVAAATSLGHIFGQSMMDHTAGMMRAAHAKLEWAATAAAIIERFAANGLHATFNRLSFSLCPVDDDNNTHEIHTHPPNRNARYGLPDRVMLTDATNGKIPLPDRRYFRLHHACATIAHLSGAGEVVEQLFRDMEDLKVLAEDGGSNHLLSLALSSRL